MKEFPYTLDQAWELTLPELAVHLEKFLPRVSEPDWFVREWRAATTGKEKAAAMQRLMR